MADRIAEVERLRGLWSEAIAASPQTVFQDFDWNLLALQTFTDEPPCFIAAETVSSIAILPIVKRNYSLALAGGPMFDYRDAIRAGDDSAFMAALEQAAGLNLPLITNGIRGEAAARRWAKVAPQAWTGAPFVSAAEMPAEAFARNHARGRRALHRLNELGAMVNREQGTPQIIDKLYRAKAKEQSSWGENVFRDERCIEFMGKLVVLPQTRCEIFLLAVTEEPIAALVTFIDGSTRRFYTVWMDPAWARHSPGVALLFEATRQTLQEGLDCDYMTGEHPYKLRFSTGSQPLYKLEATVEQLSAIRPQAAEREELKAA